MSIFKGQPIVAQDVVDLVKANYPLMITPDYLVAGGCPIVFPIKGNKFFGAPSINIICNAQEAATSIPLALCSLSNDNVFANNVTFNGREWTSFIFGSPGPPVYVHFYNYDGIGSINYTFLQVGQELIAPNKWGRLFSTGSVSFPDDTVDIYQQLIALPGLKLGCIGTRYKANDGNSPLFLSVAIYASKV